MLQKYKVIGKKGEGSFAEVLTCQNTKNGKLYACKRLKRKFSCTNEVLNLAEIQALRRISPHSNIVRLFDVIFDQMTGKLSLVFELMDVNMHELLKARKRPLPEFRAKNYMYQLLKSLNHIHRHGIFHRDIKPENLLIKDNLLKLADFGSSRSINTKPPYTEYISTRWYRPPECLLTNGFYSFKMDMWAAGCVFFEVLTNTPLFPGKSEVDQIAKIHNILGTPKPHILAKLFKYTNSFRLDVRFTPMEGSGLPNFSPQISTDARHLISLLCTYDQDERINARQALNHPYFRNIRIAEKYRNSHRSSSITDMTTSWSRDSYRAPQLPRASSLDLKIDKGFSMTYRIKKDKRKCDYPVAESWMNDSQIINRRPKPFHYGEYQTPYLPTIQPHRAE